VSLIELLPSSQIRVPLLARTKAGIIDELLELLPIEDPAVRRQVRAAVFEREAEASTGIGRGVAIPHAQTPAVEDHLCAFGVAPEPVDFAAIDGEPCRLFILCVSHPEDTERHLALLSELAALLNDPRRHGRLAAARDADDASDVIGSGAVVTP
jgi:PTS system fructose-specific IIC component